MSNPGGYSSQSYNPASKGGGPKKSYPTNGKPDLIDPANRKMDPKDQSAKTKEKDEMVGLNDKFVAFIDKVKHLEDENKVLDKRLKVLMERENYKGKISELVRQTEGELQRKVDCLERDRLKLEAELQKHQDDVDHTKQKYEDEYQKKSELENDFVVTKKEVDEGQLAVVDLALDLDDIVGELDFLRQGFNEEIKEMESQVQNETIVMKDTSKRALDMDEIIDSMKHQYADMAARTRDEAEQWNQKKMDDHQLNAGRVEQDVREMKKDVSELLRLIQKLRGDLEALRKRKEAQEQDIKKAERENRLNLEQTRDSIAQLEEGLRSTKMDMARQVRQYQELMNLKLALDIEIATYRKLLEEEEQRMANHMRQQQTVDY